MYYRSYSFQFSAPPPKHISFDNPVALSNIHVPQEYSVATSSLHITQENLAATFNLISATIFCNIPCRSSSTWSHFLPSTVPGVRDLCPGAAVPLLRVRGGHPHRGALWRHFGASIARLQRPRRLRCPHLRAVGTLEPNFLHYWLVNWSRSCRAWPRRSIAEFTIFIIFLITILLAFQSSIIFLYLFPTNFPVLSLSSCYHSTESWIFIKYSRNRCLERSHNFRF